MDWTGGRKGGSEGGRGGKVWYGSHVVEMEMERREEGGKRRGRNSETDHIPFPNNTKEESTTCIHIPTSYKSVQRYKYTRDTLSTFLPPTS